MATDKIVIKGAVKAEAGKGMEPSFLRVCAQHEYVISFQNLRRDAFLGGNMVNVVIMPKVGITVTDCILTTWYKKVGDTVQKGEPLFSYETDKASFEEAAQVAGTVLDVFFDNGDEIVESEVFYK